MSKRVQLRRGTAVENDNFTGAVGEVTVDTTNNTLRVHDGTTVGGTEIVKASQLPTPASTTKQGLIELATQAEVNTGTDSELAVTPATLKNTLPSQIKTQMNAIGSAPMFACRAWVNFNAVPLSGTYTQSGGTVTVTMANHGMTVGQVVNLTVTSGNAGQGNMIITSVPDVNTFTYTAAIAMNTAGNMTRNLFIKASGNITSVTDNGVGDYTINFDRPMPDANYAVTFGASDGASGSATPKVLTSSNAATVPYAKNQFGVRVGHASSPDTFDFSVVVFR